MFVQVITPATDPTPIITVAEALQEFREQDPSAEPDAWERRIAAAERAFEKATGVHLRPVTVRAEGRSVSTQMVWLPVGPIRTLTAYSTDGTAGDPTTLRIVGINTIGFATTSGWGYGYGFSGQLTIEAEVGFDPGDIPTQEPEIKQALLSLVGYWAESGREAAQSQTAPLGGPLSQTPFTYAEAIERWRLTVAA
jgi:hypothetical protein